MKIFNHFSWLVAHFLPKYVNRNSGVQRLRIFNTKSASLYDTPFSVSLEHTFVLISFILLNVEKGTETLLLQ